jgi:hypothetical protein
MLLLTLAACDQPEAPPVPAATTTETAIPAEPDGGIGDGAGPPDAPGEGVPARFLGVWDSGDCSAASETRVEITPRQIEYYESVGAVTRASHASGGDVLIDVKMEGEGMTWTDEIRLQLTTIQSREALLVLPGPDSDIVLRPVPLFRCPA